MNPSAWGETVAPGPAQRGSNGLSQEPAFEMRLADAGPGLLTSGTTPLCLRHPKARNPKEATP